VRARHWNWPELLIGSLAIVARIIPGPRTIDDAFITFRYAQNLLSGHGLVYNPGEAVLGTTTPLYAILMAGLARLVGGRLAPFPLLALLVNAVADALTCWLLIKLAGFLGHRRAGIAAALVWAIAPMSVTFAIGGMETSVFIALVTATLYLVLTDRPAWGALAGSLSLVARPDALLMLLPLGLERLRRAFPRARWNLHPLPVSGSEVLAFVLPVGGWAAAATAIYGSPIPLTISAKELAYALPPEAALVRLLQHYATPFMGNLTFGNWWIAVGLFIFPALFGLGALMALREHAGSWPAWIFPWIYLAAYSIANPLIFRWYLVPPLPLYMLGIMLGAERLSRDLRSPVPIYGIALAALLLTLHGWVLHPDHGPDHPAPQMAYIQLELLYERAGIDLRQMLKPGDVLAAADIGALGYTTGARILDTVGLITPSAQAYYPVDPALRVINYAVPAPLVDQFKPDYLVILEVYGRKTLLRDSSFASQYQLIETLPTDIYGSRGMLLYQRRDHP
jgi:hypothetical protein